MPYAKRKTKKRYRRRRRYIPKSLSFAPLGKKTYANLRYVGQVSIDPSIGTNGTYIFKANDLFDPDQTGTGHQPYGFDQMMDFYQRFTVLSSKIKVTGFSNTVTGPYFLAVRLVSNTSPTTSPEDFLETSGTKYIPIAQEHGAKSIRHSFSAKSFFGKRFLGASPDFSGNTSASPSELAYFHVVVVPISPTDDPGIVRLTVECDFNTVFTEPKRLINS